MVNMIAAQPSRAKEGLVLSINPNELSRNYPVFQGPQNPILLVALICACPLESIVPTFWKNFIGKNEKFYFPRQIP